MTAIAQNLSRTEAADYLKEAWGITRTKGTLAKLATIGGGPRFLKVNRGVLYPKPQLDEWAASLMSPLKSSTSERT